MATLALCMIVKNEAALIERCLDSVRPLIDYVMIQDTGSSDGTQAIIRQWLQDREILGKVVEEPWKDFSHNRSLALAELRQRNYIDYALVMDADDVMVFDPGFDPAAFKESLTSDIYYATLKLKEISYHRAVIVSNKQPWHYRGVVHEFLDVPDIQSTKQAMVTKFHILASTEGSRSRDPDKYRKDAELLETALAGRIDIFLRQRYQFYLAQSWRDCGEDQKALDAYIIRAGLGGWNEEVFQSLYHAGKIHERTGSPTEMTLGYYLRAWNAFPWRAESLHAASCLCRVERLHQIGYMVTKEALKIMEPQTGLFVEPWVYQYGLLDELAVHAYWTGHFDECISACERLLSEGRIPDTARVSENLRFARERLSPSGSIQNPVHHL